MFVYTLFIRLQPYGAAAEQMHGDAPPGCVYDGHAIASEQVCQRRGRLCSRACLTRI